MTDEQGERKEKKKDKLDTVRDVDELGGLAEIKSDSKKHGTSISSIICPSEKIDSENWLIFLASKIKPVWPVIYLEGVNHEGENFVEIYISKGIDHENRGLLSGYTKITGIQVQFLTVDTVKKDIDQLVYLPLEISRHTGEIFRRYVKDYQGKKEKLYHRPYPYITHVLGGHVAELLWCRDALAHIGFEVNFPFSHMRASMCILGTEFLIQPSTLETIQQANRKLIAEAKINKLLKKTFLNTISFHNCEISFEQIENLASAIINHPTLLELRLDNASLTDIFLDAIAEALAQNLVITMLTYSENSLLTPASDLSKKKIQAYLYRNRLLSLEQITMADLKETDLVALRPVDLRNILTRHPNLARLDFSNKYLAPGTLLLNPKSWPVYSALTHTLRTKESRRRR